MTETITQRREALLLELRQSIANEVGEPVERIDAADTFFRFGIGSAATVNIIATLSHRLGIEIDPVLLWDSDSLAAFAEQVVRDPAAG